MLVSFGERDAGYPGAIQPRADPPYCSMSLAWPARRGAHPIPVIHQDTRPENILLHDGRPMVAGVLRRRSLASVLYEMPTGEPSHMGEPGATDQP